MVNIMKTLDFHAEPWGCTLGVGDGSGKLFVHGDYDSIKTVQKKLLELEELRVENAKLRAEANDAVEKISPKQYLVDTVNRQLQIKKKHLAKIYDGLSTGMIDIPEAGSDDYDKDAEF